MPSVITVDITIGEMKFWNVNVRVGAGGITRGMDVSLCQWLLSVTRKPESPPFDASDVIGVWGPKSRAILAHVEKKNPKLISTDGCIDPIKPGQTKGSISGKRYKMIVLQITFLQFMTGETNLQDAVLTGNIRINELEKILMSMPEDSANMPADLKFAMINTRDTGSPEF